MLRDPLIKYHIVDDFRWRSREVSRIEGFSDAVFGFAVTLLIVSLEVPHTSTELLATMHSFGGFVVTFFMLSSIWYSQFIFFRRYGLEDRVTVILNLALLFTVLFFVYPLKFLFTLLLRDPLMKGKIQTAHGMELAILPQHKPWILTIFGLGFAAIFLIFILLYRHAYARRKDLELDELEIFETGSVIRRQATACGIGLLYVALGFASSLPHGTQREKDIFVAADFGVELLMLALLGNLIRLQIKRKKFVRAWRNNHKLATPAGFEAPQVIRPSPE